MAKMCQSCSIPKTKDPAGGGTESDGSKSEIYCSFCYQNGAFTAPGFTVEDMQKLCIEKLREQGMPKVLAWLFTRGLPKLERWRASD